MTIGTQAANRESKEPSSA